MEDGLPGPTGLHAVAHLASAVETPQEVGAALTQLPQMVGPIAPQAQQILQL